KAAEALDSLGDALLIGGNDLAEVFGVQAGRQSRGADQVGEHHSDLAALGTVFRAWAWGIRRGRYVKGRRLTVWVATQGSNGVQQLHTMPKRRDAKLLEVLVRQARQNRLVYVIFAENCLVLPKAQALQPDHNVHDGPRAHECSIALSERAAEVI